MKVGWKIEKFNLGVWADDFIINCIKSKCFGMGGTSGKSNRIPSVCVCVMGI